MRWLTFNDRPLYTRGIVAGLRQLGVEVVVIKLNTGPEPQNREIAQAIDSCRPDVVFTPGWAHDLVNPVALFSVLRRKGVPHVYWATEDPTFFHDVSLKFAPYSDVVFTTTAELVDRYVRLGIPTGVLLFGCNPGVHCPMPREARFEHDVVLVANNYITGSHCHEVRRHTTEQMVIPLVKAGVDLRIWGLWWDAADSAFRIPARCLAGPLPYEHAARVYSSGRIVLGLQFDNSSLTQTSCRLFEVLGSGGFHLAPETPATAALFTNGVHLVLSASPQETLELARHYLARPVAREKIARAGREHVLAHHTYRHRAAQMLELVSTVTGKGEVLCAQ